MSTVREIKVQYAVKKKNSRGDCNRIPKIQLQGDWLKNAGFKHTDKIKVIAKNGKISIEKI